MLFIISPSILNILEDETKQNTLVGALDELTMAYQKGYHLLYADYEVLKVLKEYPPISLRTRSTFAYLFNRFSTMRPPYEHITRYFEIIPEYDIVERRNVNGKEIIKLSINYFSQKSLSAKAILLSENLNDTEFYKTVGEVYKSKNRLRGLRIIYQPIGGGGSTLANQYEQIQNAAEYFCLAIIDSDKGFPNSSCGMTAKNTFEIKNPQSIFSDAYMLPTREIENLVPSRIYAEITNGSRERQKTLTLLRRMENRESYKFFDIKKGIYYYELANSQSNGYHEYWSNELKTHGYPITCPEGNDCNKGKDEKCDYCKIVTGFNDPLPEIIEFLKEKSIQVIKGYISRDLESEWDELGKTLVTWFCANSPTIAI